MARLTLRLPETLHQHLETRARAEGVSLNQYIVYALARQTAPAYTVLPVPEEAAAQQRARYQQLIDSLGHARPADVEGVLADREAVPPEPGVSPRAASYIKKHRSARRTRQPAKGAEADALPRPLRP